MPFFDSIVYTGTRVGGQRERETQAFEAGLPYFPRDYPFTQSYIVHAKERENQEREQWSRKPPAKRVNYEKLGVRSPWKADWEVVLGLPGTVENTDGEFVTTQREDDMDITLDHALARPWLLRGRSTQQTIVGISDMLNPGAGLLEELNRLRRGRSLDALSATITSTNLLKGALTLVTVTMCKRGVPQDIDSIHIMDDEELVRWMKIMQRNRGGLVSSKTGNEIDEELQLAEVRPSPSSIIGYVTTGHHSLSQSKGFAIGAVSLSRMLELEAQIRRLSPNNHKRDCATKMKPLVKVRDREGRLCRVAYLSVFVGDSTGCRQ
ncbi:hypothetical protein AX17_004990 [Amanita inopinata Kibby_2008]|nr:hypothetical protein AX17_004990 [Amanita inopinata Kibby_2008]